jgi:RNA polymerase sigma factor (sigma-70 family)
MHAQADDIVIIQEVLQGRQSAYTVIVERYQQYVFTLVMRFVDNREVAEELAQDVFVKAYRCLADFKGTSKFSTWLYTIVNTTCLSYLRKKRDETILLEEERMVSICDNAFLQKPTDRLERKAESQLMDNAIKQLVGSDAELLTLFYYGEQSVEEIGTIIGLTPANVKVRLFRARQKLREILRSQAYEGAFS